MDKIKNWWQRFKNFIFYNKKIAVIVGSIFLLVIIFWLVIAIASARVKLSCNDVEDIVVRKIGGGHVTACERRRRVYEVRVVSNNYEYQFRVNANTGEVIDYDGEYIGS